MKIIDSTYRLTLVAILTLVTGCAQIKLGEPVASKENISAAKASGMPAVNVGNFVLASNKPAEMDQYASIRTNKVEPPTDGSFSKYLRESLISELKAAALFNPNSNISIEGQLTNSEIDAPIGKSFVVLAAKFKVLREGSTAYDKELSVRKDFESPFLGATAIPEAINKYSQLYRRLINKLLKDQSFINAVKP